MRISAGLGECEGDWAFGVVAWLLHSALELTVTLGRRRNRLAIDSERDDTLVVEVVDPRRAMLTAGCMVWECASVQDEESATSTPKEGEVDARPINVIL